MLVKGPWVRCYSQGQQGFLHGSRGDGHRVGGWSQCLSSTHHYLAGVGRPGREQSRNHEDLEDSVVPPFLLKKKKKKKRPVPTKKQLPSSAVGTQYQPPPPPPTPRRIGQGSVMKWERKEEEAMSHLRVSGLLLTTLQGRGEQRGSNCLDQLHPSPGVGHRGGHRQAPPLPAPLPASARCSLNCKSEPKPCELNATPKEEREQTFKRVFG